MKRRAAKLEKTSKHIAEAYPDVYDGLQKDAGQNSWDARLTKKGRGWRLVFRYIPEYKALCIEDFGTTGMDQEGWNNYQGLWFTEKEKTPEGGARGQGKFLFHYFSSKDLVLTESIDGTGTYRFSFGTSGEYDDESKTLEDFFPKETLLNHQGTRIWIVDLKPELLEGLLDINNFTRLIAASRWEIIRDYGAAFVVNFDGTDREVVLPRDPVVKKKKRFPPSKLDGLGTISNLVIQCCDSEIDPFFRGIAIQRAGMTILRLLPIADESVKNKITGYCNFSDDLEEGLKAIEYPNHMAFQNRSPWIQVREFVSRKLDDFVLELSPKSRKPIVDRRGLEDAAKLVNKLVSQHMPELLEGVEAPGGRGRKGKKPEKPRGPLSRPSVRILTFEPNSRELDFGDTLIISCELVNELKSSREVELGIRVYHEETKYEKYPGENYPGGPTVLKLGGGNKETIDIPLIDFSTHDKPGRYIGEGRLSTRGRNEPIHIKTFAFYFHETPPKGRSFVRYFIPAFGKGLFFEKWRYLPINDERDIHVIWDNPEFVRLREGAGNSKGWKYRKEVQFYCTKCGIEEATRKKVELLYTEEKLDTESLKEVLRVRDSMIYEAHIEIFS